MYFIMNYKRKYVSSLYLYYDLLLEIVLTKIALEIHNETCHYNLLLVRKYLRELVQILPCILTPPPPPPLLIICQYDCTCTRWNVFLVVSLCS